MRLRNNSLIFITTLAAICIQVGSGLSKLQLTADGHYRNLLVFVQIPANASQSALHYTQLLRIMETALREASDILQTLTEPVGRRLSFGDVSVLVPYRLGRQLADLNFTGLKLHPATWQRRDRADFVVSPDFKEAEEGPKWKKYACGKPAKNVQVTTESLEPSRSHKIARSIVLYFSQYRWGLESEAPLREPMHGSVSSSDVELPEPSACSQALQTKLLITSGSRRGLSCNSSDAKQLNSSCRIVVTEPANSNAASFLFSPYSFGVTRFCDSATRTSDPKHVHNKGAYNKFNLACFGYSAAEVMRMHEDFQQPGSSSASTDSKFNFQLVVEPNSQRVVIVMDTSGSMSHENRLTSMIAAVNHYLSFILETGSECALVSFSNKPKVLQNFILVDSPAVRRQLMQSVSKLTAGGGTCIGGAVQLAMKLLGEDPEKPTQRSTGKIILISDGMEGCTSVLDSVISALSNTSLKVDTIRFGNKADIRMTRLSQVTGGLPRFSTAKSEFATSKLILQLISTTSDLAGANRTVVLASERVPLEFRPLQFNVRVRSSLVFSLFLPSEPSKVGSLRLMIRSPSGKTFNCSGGSSGVCTVDAAVGSVNVQIPDTEIETGRWTLANLAVPHGRRRRRQTGSFLQVIVSGSLGKDSLPRHSMVGVSPETVEVVKEDSDIYVYVIVSPRANGSNYSMYAVVTADNTQVARLKLYENKRYKGSYLGRIPLSAVKKARQYTAHVFVTYPIVTDVSAGTLTVLRDNPNFDRRRVIPNSITDMKYVTDYPNKIIRIFWSPVVDPSGLLKDGAFVPKYSLRFDRLINSSCNLRFNPSSCEELVCANQSSVNVYSQYWALGKPQIWVTAIAISAANVSGVPSARVKLALPPTLTIDDIKRLGLRMDDKKTTASTTLSLNHSTTAPSLVSYLKETKSSARNSTETKSSPRNSTETKSSPRNSTETKSTPRNSTETKSSAQFNLSWISVKTICSLAVVTVGMSHINGFG